jgi:2-polyprenyl-3-methyl-5-hydroxy-6-metoxy-1,4-benzoquinol methylase
MNKEKAIIDSWHTNANAWIDIIGNNGIESRKLITNKAIIDAVMDANPSTALDIGCGEGWLAKELADRGVVVTGIDVIPALIENAKAKTPGTFIVASYEDIAEGRVSLSHPFDAIVINFALIGKESTELLLKALPPLLTANGRLFIQTLHPYSREESGDYTTGWKTGSWNGLGDQFTQPYEWYFRTMEDWIQLLNESGFNKVIAADVLHPVNGSRLSVIFQCQVTV